MLNHHNFGSVWANGTTTGSLLYTYEGLTAEDLEFISALPFMQTIDPNGKCPIRICHGSPEKTRDTLRPFSYKIESWLLKIDERVLLSGHTHQPCSAHTMGKLYVNPGAVGMQCTQTVTAKMALLDSDGNTWNETLLEVPYDIDAAALEIRESGLLTRAGVWGHAILKQLYTGKNYSLFCVQRAEELAAGGPVLLEHWQQAARDFGILEG